MDFIVLITLLSKIVCSKNESINILKEIDKNTLGLKVAETTTEIFFKIKSGDYLPVFGTWHSGENCFAFDNLFIRNDDIYEWLRKNISDEKKLIDFLNDCSDMYFEFQTEKRHLIKCNYNFEFRLKIIRKNDLKNIWIKYLESISLFKSF